MIKGDISLSDKYKKQEKTPGILARLRKVAGLNIGTIMFGTEHNSTNIQTCNLT